MVYDAILVTTSRWFDGAKRRNVKVFHFPPGKNPNVDKLENGSRCIIFLKSPKMEFCGDFTVKEVRLVSGYEFERYKDLAYEVPECPFPKPSERAWIIIFDELYAYPRPIPKDECFDIKPPGWKAPLSRVPIRGLFLIKPEYRFIVEKLREKAKMSKPLPKIELKAERIVEEEAQELIKGLKSYVERATAQLRRFPDMNEEDAKAVLIEPLLKILGWDTGSLEDVKRNFPIVIGRKPVYLDYVLKVNGKPRILVEAKAPSEDLDRFIQQVLSYAKVADIDWAVLTNGRELRVYHASWKTPLYRLSIEEYVREAEKLRSLSKESISTGSLDKKAKEEYTRRAVLEWLREHRDQIALQIASSHRTLNNQLVKRILEEILSPKEDKHHG